MSTCRRRKPTSRRSPISLGRPKRNLSSIRCARSPNLPAAPPWHHPSQAKRAAWRRKTPPGPTLQPRSFNREIPKVAMTASFTGLNVAAMDLGEVDPDPLRDSETDIVIEPARDKADLSIFTFDRGRRTGDFFHGVLEHMDFEDLKDLSALIEGTLRAFGFSPPLPRPALNQIFQTLMDVELDPGIRLRQISRSERLSEVEFTYPLAQLTPASLAKAIKKCTGLAADIRKRMGSLHFDPIRGF